MQDKLERLAKTLTPGPREVAPSRSAAPPASVEEFGDGADFSLRDYWRVVHSRRGAVAVCIVAALVAAGLYTAVRTPTYRAAATLQIDREQPGMAEIGEDNYPEIPEQPDYLETQYKVLRSRTLAKRVIGELGLDERAELRHGLEEEDLEGRESLHPAILERFLDRLEVRPAKGTRLVDVSYESVDPELATRVANTLAEDFVEYNLEARWAATQRASSWLEEQLASLERRLQESEGRLQDYAAAHSILLVAETKDITTEKLSQLEQELTRAEADRVEQQSTAIMVRDALERRADLPGTLGSKAYDDLRTQLAQLERERSRLGVRFEPAYPAVRQVQEEIERIEAALGAERERILSSVNERYEAAVEREKLLRESVAAQRGKVTRISDDFIEYNILKRDAETNRKLYEGLLQRLKEAGVAASLRASNIAVLDPAEVPEEPYRPRPFVNLTLGLLAGLLLGVGAAFTLEQLDTSVKTPEEVERLTGLGLLAVIPRLPGRPESKVVTAAGDPEDDGAAGGLVRWAPPDGLSEAYRTLRSSVLLGWDDSMRRILVTSSQPQEGKTTLSLNLACSLAQLGRRVLLIDADMRRPDCGRQLGIQGAAGLSEHLCGDVSLDEALHATKIPGLTLIPAGKSTTRAADLLYSPHLSPLLEEAGRRFDHVVIDSPPSLVLSDARTISRMVEGVLMVVSDQTERGSLLRTKQMFDDAGVRFLGFVMNRVDLGRLDYGYYRDYGYYYSYNDEQSRRDGRSRERRGKALDKPNGKAA